MKVKFFNQKINFAVWHLFTCKFRIILISIISLLLLSQTSPAIAQTTKTPKTCKMGAYITSLHDFNLPENSFDADLWLWSVCPSEDLKPLKNLDFINAKEAETSLYETFQRKKGYWSNLKINGSFRYNWNVRNFLFDRHILQIIIEDGNAVASDFIYTADNKTSKYSPDITLTGWRINNFTVTQKIN